MAEPQRDTVDPVDAPPSDAGTGTSIYDLVSDKSATKDLADLQRRKVTETERLVSSEDRALAEDRTMAKNFLDRESIGPNDLQKWDVKHEREKYRTDPIESFGSVASVFAIAASAFTKAPMENALNGAAAAMNAAREGNEREYDKAYTAWKDNNELVIKRQNMMHTQYTDALSLMAHDVTLGDAKLRQIAARYGDQQALTLLEHGYAPQLIEMIQARSKAVEGLIQVQEHSDEYSLRTAAFQADVKQNPRMTADEKMAKFEFYMGAKTDTEREWMRQYWASHPSTGDRKVDFDNFNAEWRKHQEAKYPYRGQAQLGSNTALVQAEFQRIKKNNPDMEDADALELAHKRAAAAHTRAGTREDSLQVQRAALKDQHSDWTDAKIDEEANKIVTAARTKRTEGAARQETKDEKAKQYMEEGMSKPEAAVRATRWEKLMTAVPSGNRIDQLKSRADQIKYATERVNEVERMLKKHNLITGLGGKIVGRPTEIMGNVLGSNSTDYKQFERTVNELQQLMPRILTDSSGRPLGVEAGHVNSVVAGLNAGDTLQGTVRAYTELKKQLHEMATDTQTRIHGGMDEPRAAPAGPAPRQGGTSRWQEAPVVE